MRYMLIPKSEVDDRIFKAAMMALADGRKELKLPDIQVRWFTRPRYAKNPVGTLEAEDNTLGQFRKSEPDTIYIFAPQLEDNIKQTVYHECFHCYHWLQGNGWGDIEAAEGLARGYSEYMLKMRNIQDREETAYYEWLTGADKDWASPKNVKAMNYYLGKDWSTDHLRKEMDRRLGRKPKAAPTKAPKPQPDPRQGGYDKWTNRPSADGFIYKT